MDGIVTLCLAAAGICAVLFMVILHKIFRELFPRAKPVLRAAAAPQSEPSHQEPSVQSEEDRTAALLLRHSFVITMMERYQATGASGDVIDFINHELRNRDAGWRVRILPDGSGEFFDMPPGAMDIAPSKVRLASGR